MKGTSNKFLRAMAKSVGLKVRFVDYLDNGTYGKLLPREKRILINAHKPRYEHKFTMLHELGHFQEHVLKNPHRKRHPRIFDIRWNFALWTKLASLARRYFRFHFNKESGREWEADLWAMCAFVYLAIDFGCRDDLMEFLNHHPEKNRLFWLAVCGVIYAKTKERIANAFKFLAAPFRAL